MPTPDRAATKMGDGYGSPSGSRPMLEAPAAANRPPVTSMCAWCSTWTPSVENPCAYCDDDGWEYTVENGTVWQLPFYLDGYLDGWRAAMTEAKGGDWSNEMPPGVPS